MFLVSTMSHRQRLWSVTALAVFLALPAAAADSAATKAIYGRDDRMEVENAPRALREAGRSVVAIFGKSVLFDPDGVHPVLPVSPTGWDQNWCPEERFAEQTTTASCSGFLIAPDRIATSAHCIKPPDDPYAPGLACGEARIVFDYRLGHDGVMRPYLRSDQVFRCKAVVAGDYLPRPLGQDWRVVQLDRPVDRRPLYVADMEPPEGNETLYVIGHPAGLPAKVGTGHLNGKGNQYDFVTDLDTYQGSSGSPVLSEIDGRLAVVGIFSSGVSDFVRSPDETACVRSRRCSGEDCEGERATVSSLLAPYASLVIGR